MPDPATAGADSIEAALQLLREIFSGIQEVYVKPVPVDLLLESALRGIQSELDPHTKVLTAEEFQALRSRQGSSVGLGITVGFCEDRPVIREIRSDSPAQRAGLRPGDLLLAADGVDLAGADLEQVMESLRGPLGSTLHVTILSPDRGQVEIDVPRETVGRSALASCRLRGGRVGYLGVRRFARGLSDRIEDVLAEWSDDAPDVVLIDLRDNPGGFLDEAARAADLFLPLGAGIVRTVGRLPEENGVMIAQRAPVFPPVPLAVLVDSLTASSAEIFAGALQGRPGVVLAGEETYGKRSVQRLRTLSNGGALKVTASYYCTPGDPEFCARMRGPAPGGSAAGDPLREEISIHNQPRQALGARGRRLVPDLPLSRDFAQDPANALEACGLLQRFIGEQTFPPSTAPGLGFWRAEEAPVPPQGEADAYRRWCAEAPGFERWHSRLRERLRAWGWSPDLAASPRLRAAWFTDWAEERWGAVVAEQAGLELDPWLVSAVREAGDLASCAAARGQSVTQLAPPGAPARR